MWGWWIYSWDLVTDAHSRTPLLCWWLQLGLVGRVNHCMTQMCWERVWSIHRSKLCGPCTCTRGNWVLGTWGCSLRGRLSTGKHSLLRFQYSKVVIGVMNLLVGFENSADVQPENCHVRQTWHLAFPLPSSSLLAVIRKMWEKSSAKC